MNTTTTIPELIQYFDDRVHQIDRRRIGNNIGKEPQFPLLIVFLGENAINSFQSVSTHLFQLWPQYREELQFLGVLGTEMDMEYQKLSLSNNQIKKDTISQEQIGEMVSTLFGLGSHYQDHTSFLVYYIMDTTQFTSCADFQSWMQILYKVKTSLGVDTLDMLDTLLLLLNENITERRAVATDIKDSLYEYLDGYIESVLLLSNRRSDNIILEEWEQCYKIIASLIALTNNSDTHIMRAVFKKGVYTASYACEEKPSYHIGQVIVKELINKLASENFNVTVNTSQVKDLAGRLGLSQEKTVKILDNYAEDALYKLLPDEEKLMLFPRRDNVEYDSIASLSEKSFNDITMYTWKSYLDKIVLQAEKHIKRDSTMRNRWHTEYAQIISNNFSIGELIWMKEHLGDIRKIMSDARQPSSEMYVLSAARARLCYMLSKNSSIIDIFINVIEELGKKAEEFLESWRQLLNSRLTIHSIRDESISKFYKRKAALFFDYKEQNIVNQFSRISDMDDLKIFLTEIINNIIDHDSIFSKPFEDELEARLQEEDSPYNVKQYIRKKLTSDEVPIYFQTSFSFSSPTISAILLNVGTSLHQNLEINLPSTTYYYDTGSRNAAEAIKIYEISADNLIKG